MSGYYKQTQHGTGSGAERMLRERLEREEIGDTAYEEMVSYRDDRAFKMFGVVFIVLCAVVALGVVWLGY